MIMNINKFPWEQHANPRMRVRGDGRYWVIAEPTTWDADDSCEYAARIYHGTFPIRLAEVGIAWGDSMDLALGNAIEILERHLPAVEVRLGQSAENGSWAPAATRHNETDALRRQFADEWQL
jgi:hypothetical protein